MTDPDWLIKGAEGIDVIDDTRSTLQGLAGLNMIVQPVASDSWSISADEAARGLAMGTPGTPTQISGAGGLPAICSATTIRFL